jgi:hypothetical protein
MDLGSDAEAVARRLSRRRTVWLVAGALGALVFVVFVIGTTVSLADPGYVLDDGELAADFGVLAGAAALVALAAFRIRAGERRAITVFARLDVGNWLPPHGRRTSGGLVDLGTETRRLGTLSRRAVLIALLWCGVLAGAVAGLTAIQASAGDLLATGSRTVGEVVSVVDPRSGDGAPSMWVRYRVGGTSWTEEIVRDSDRGYLPGEEVTVVYDPADPADVRTVEERNENQYAVGFSVVPLVIALVAVPWSLLAAGRWRHRHRAVRQTGWRVAAVTVVPDYPVRRGRHAPDIHVRYDDGSVIALRAVSSTHGATILKNRPGRRAWVGGWGRQMVVLVPDAPGRKRPYAVPAYARSLRKDAG